MDASPRCVSDDFLLLGIIRRENLSIGKDLKLVLLNAKGYFKTKVLRSEGRCVGLS